MAAITEYKQLDIH